ncbi:MAG: inorganic phosphate transporter, partial [Pseudomonas sp.]
MTTPTLASNLSGSVASPSRPQLDRKPSMMTLAIFFAVLGIGLLFTAYSLMHDMNELGTVVTTWT